MGKLFVWEFLTLDGVMESPDQWVAPYFSPDVAETVSAQNFACDALLLGRQTFQDFVAFWPHQTSNEFDFADHLNTIPKYVASSTLTNAEWKNSSIIKNDALNEIAKLKHGHNIGITGSISLVQSLLEANQIDALRLLVFPVVVGKGKRLFNEGMSTKTWKLMEAKGLTSGVVSLLYKTTSE